MSAKARLIAHTEAQTTEHLVTGMLMLDGKSTGHGYAGLDEAEVLTLMTIGDVLLARFPEADTMIDGWMEKSDDDADAMAFITDNSWADLIAVAIDRVS